MSVLIPYLNMATYINHLYIHLSTPFLNSGLFLSDKTMINYSLYDMWYCTPGVEKTFGEISGKGHGKRHKRWKKDCDFLGGLLWGA